MDLNNIANQYLGGNAPQGAPAELGQWLQQYQSGNGNQVPHQQVQQAYSQWAQQASPQEVQQATNYGYQQVPQQEHPGIGSALLSMFQQKGLNPQSAGVQTTNPQEMTPQDLSNMTAYAHQQAPDALHQMFQPGGALSNPMVGMALAGALAYGLNRMSNQGR